MLSKIRIRHQLRNILSNVDFAIDSSSSYKLDTSQSYNNYCVTSGSWPTTISDYSFSHSITGCGYTSTRISYTTSFVTPSTWYAYAIQVRWAASDLCSLETDPLTYGANRPRVAQTPQDRCRLCHRRHPSAVSALAVKSESPSALQFSVLSLLELSCSPLTSCSKRLPSVRARSRVDTTAGNARNASGERN